MWTRYQDLRGGYDEAYRELYRRQCGKCGVCSIKLGEQPGADQPGSGVMDHNHTTGHIRGLVCKGCNTRIGLFEKYGPQGRKWEQDVMLFLDHAGDDIYVYCDDPEVERYFQQVMERDD